MKKYSDYYAQSKKETVLKDVVYPEVTIRNVPVILDKYDEKNYYYSSKVFDRVFKLRLQNESDERLEIIDYTEE